MHAPSPAPARLALTAAFAAAAVTCLPAPALAAPPVGHSAPSAGETGAVSFAAKPVDVKLAGGALRGRLVDGAGAPIANAPVAIHRPGEAEPAVKTVSAADGSFTLAGAPRGEARVVTARGSQAVRVWDGAAPPKALDTLALVAVDPAVRGNYGLFCDPALNLSMALGATAVVLSAVTLGQIDDLEDDNDRIFDELDDIRDFVSP